MAGLQHRWIIGDLERNKNVALFYSMEPVEGLLSGEKARELFVRSRLDMRDLSRAWSLSDLDEDGQLSLPEFLIAMHLIQALRNHVPLPDTLPETLLPPMVAANDIAKLTSSEVAAYNRAFCALDTNRLGFLHGDVAKPIMKKSLLPVTQLAHVWRLADMDSDGQLSRSEFGLAMHLMRYVRKGYLLPTFIDGAAIISEYHSSAVSDITTPSSTHPASPPAADVPPALPAKTSSLSLRGSTSDITTPSTGSPPPQESPPNNPTTPPTSSSNLPNGAPASQTTADGGPGIPTSSAVPKHMQGEAAGSRQRPNRRGSRWVSFSSKRPAGFFKEAESKQDQQQQGEAFPSSPGMADSSKPDNAIFLAEENPFANDSFAKIEEISQQSRPADPFTSVDPFGQDPFNAPDPFHTSSSADPFASDDTFGDPFSSTAKAASADMFSDDGFGQPSGKSSLPTLAEDEQSEQAEDSARSNQQANQQERPLPSKPSETSPAEFSAFEDSFTAASTTSPNPLTSTPAKASNTSESNNSFGDAFGPPLSSAGGFSTPGFDDAFSPTPEDKPSTSQTGNVTSPSAMFDNSFGAMSQGTSQPPQPGPPASQDPFGNAGNGSFGAMPKAMTSPTSGPSTQNPDSFSSSTTPVSAQPKPSTSSGQATDPFGSSGNQFDDSFGGTAHSQSQPSANGLLTQSTDPFGTAFPTTPQSSSQNQQSGFGDSFSNPQMPGTQQQTLSNDPFAPPVAAQQSNISAAVGFDDAFSPMSPSNQQNAFPPSQPLQQAPPPPVAAQPSTPDPFSQPSRPSQATNNTQDPFSQPSEPSQATTSNTQDPFSQPSQSSQATRSNAQTDPFGTTAQSAPPSDGFGDSFVPFSTGQSAGAILDQTDKPRVEKEVPSEPQAASEEAKPSAEEVSKQLEAKRQQRMELQQSIMEEIDKDWEDMLQEVEAAQPQKKSLPNPATMVPSPTSGSSGFAKTKNTAPIKEDKVVSSPPPSQPVATPAVPSFTSPDGGRLDPSGTQSNFEGFGMKQPVPLDPLPPVQPATMTTGGDEMSKAREEEEKKERERKAAEAEAARKERILKMKTTIDDIPDFDRKWEAREEKRRQKEKERLEEEERRRASESGEASKPGSLAAFWQQSVDKKSSPPTKRANYEEAMERRKREEMELTRRQKEFEAERKEREKRKQEEEDRKKQADKTAKEKETAEAAALLQKQQAEKQAEEQKRAAPAGGRKVSGRTSALAKQWEQKFSGK